VSDSIRELATFLGLRSGARTQAGRSVA